MKLKGKVSIITGAASGIGQATAVKFVKEGAIVAVCDVNLEAAQATVAKLQAAGGEAVAYLVNVTDKAQIASMVADVKTRYGRIDVLVNNAGIVMDAQLTKMTDEQFDTVIDINLKGVYNCARAVVDTMVEQGSGVILNASSVVGLYGNFGQSNYGAAKMALVGLMQTLSIEGAKNDIRVNCLAPTAATRMTENLMPDTVLKLLQPEAVTPGLLALVADDAPTRAILCAGAGSFERAHITLTPGIFVGLPDDAAEQVALNFDALSDRDDDTVPESGSAQGTSEIGKAMRAVG